MTPITIGYISIVFLIIMLVSSMHIGVVMGLIGFIGIALISGWPAAFGTLMSVPYRTFASYDFSVIPLFILMGEFCFRARISTELYEAVHKLMGGLRGSLAIATVGACGGFAAVCGSSAATAATMGTVALPEMKSKNYGMSLACGSVAAGGTIGILIPPSVPLVIYGMMTEQSIGKLFLAGIIPGVLLTIFFVGVVLLVCFIDRKAGPPGKKSTLKEKIWALKNVWIVVVLFLLVIGGLYSGLFSPTEAAGVGAFGAFLFAVFVRRMRWNELKTSLSETAKTTAILGFIVLGAMLMSRFMAASTLPSNLATFISSLPVDRYFIWVFIVILYLGLGCILESMSLILLTVPVLYPLILQFGFDPIWFGILLVIMIEVGMITPPVGMNVYLIKGMVPEVPTYKIFKGVLPFFIADIVLIILLTAFPEIVLFLPNRL